jgi:uncharacterized membrane protein (DUF485 family)
MLHEPATPQEKDNATAYKTRLGIWMFILYALIYAGFTAINVINPVLMGTIVFAGLNLAIVYGFGLIIFALILAVVYNAMCVKKEQELNKDGGDA